MTSVITGKIFKRITAWILLLVIGVNSLGESMSSVKATEIEESTGLNDSGIIYEESEELYNISEDDSEQNVISNNNSEAIQDNILGDLNDNEIETDIPGEGIEWKDFSVEGGVIEEAFGNEEAIRLTSDIEVKDQMGIINPLWLDGNTLTVEGDLTINSNIYVDGIIVVKGNVTWANGDITFIGGKIVCNGNFRNVNSTKCNISMKSVDDYMYIGGDFSLFMYSAVESDITSGIIELAGNFVQYVNVSTGFCNTGECSFKMEGDSRLLLSGNDTQTLFIYNDNVFFDTIEVNIDGLEIDDAGNVDFGDRYIAFSGKDNYKTFLDHGCPTEKGIADYNNAIIDNSNGNIKIYGSTYINEPIDISCYSLCVVGDLIIDSAFDFTGVNITVFGDIRLQSKDKNGVFGETDGHLKITNSTNVYAYGDIVSESIIDHSEYLNRGIWNVYGNIYQNGSNYNNLPFDGSAIVNFYDGSDTEGCKRHISMDNPKGNPYAKFNNKLEKDKLVIDNCALFRGGSSVGDYEGILGLGGYYSWGGSHGSVRILEPTTISGAPTSQLIIKDDVIVEADLTIVNPVYFSGDMLVNNGILTIGNDSTSGKLHVSNLNFSDDSSTQLVMKKSGGRVYCNDFIYGSSISSGELSAGTIWCGGDFIVKDTGASDSFVASDDHEVYISGNRLHNVNIENKDSCIETLRLSEGYVKISDSTTIHKINNTKARIIKTGIEGYTLTKDEVYDGDFVLVDGTLNLNGHTLKVNGDMYAEHGAVNINGGILEVEGELNYSVNPLNHIEGETNYSTASLIMNNENDRIVIGKDYNINIGRTNLPDAVNGTISVGGNVYVDGFDTSVNSEYKKQIFNGITLEFTGDKPHVIEGGSDNIIMNLGGIISDNRQKVSSQMKIIVTHNLILKDAEGEFNNITVNDITGSDIGKVTGSITVGGGTLTNDLDVSGKLTVNGEIDMSGHKITTDSLYVNDQIHLSKGKLEVSDTLYMYDKVWMIYPEDSINTNNIIVNIETNDSDYMTCGDIYVSGSFKDTTSDDYAFLPTGNHKIIFDTDKESVGITFQNEKSILKNVEFTCAVKSYTSNRNINDIARNIIISYDDTIAPSKPANVTGTPYPFLVILSWDESTDNMDMGHYIVYRDGEEVGTTTETHYTDSVLEPGTKHYYTVRAVDMKGNQSFASREKQVMTTSDTKAPVCSGELHPVADEGSISVNLSGLASDDSCVDYYIIKKADGQEIILQEKSVFRYVDKINNTSKTIEIHEGNPILQDNGFVYGESRKYMIKAVDITGKESEPYIFTAHPDYAPNSPKNIQVISSDGCNKVIIPATEEDAFKYFDVYRNGKKVERISCVYGKKSVFIDSDVETGQTYTYSVRGIGYYGTEGELSDEYQVTVVMDDNNPVISDYVCSIQGSVLNENANSSFKVYDDGGIKSVHVYFKDKDTEYDLLNCDVSDFEIEKVFDFVINVEDLSGYYELWIEAKDNTGNTTSEKIEYSIHSDGLPAVTQIRYSTYTTYVALLWNDIEGAVYYGVEQKIGNSYKRLFFVQDSEAVIDRLSKETEYSFRVVAYDKKNIRGLASETITVITKPDTESPVITEISEDGTILGFNEPIKFSGYDNVRIASGNAAYRKSGATEWVDINSDYSYGEIKWDKAGLESGEYEVKLTLTDTSGNKSDSVIVKYQLDLNAPNINNYILTPEDWQIKVSWDAFVEDDYSYYQLERMTATEYDDKINQGQNIRGFHGIILAENVDDTSYEEIISPKEEYVYILRAYDKYNNVSISFVRGKSIDNDIFSPVISGLNSVFTAKNTELSLSASDCTDNDEIVSYTWDMGNGDIINGIDCDYIYSNPGNYDVTLTVKDKSGNETSQTTSVLVGENVGKVIIKVMDTNSIPIADADVAVCINNKPFYCGDMSQTDKKGELEMYLPKGSFKVAVYKNGYKAREVNVDVSVGHTTEKDIMLLEGNMMSATCESHQMSLDEIKQAGIDPNDVGEHVMQYTLVLEFEGKKIEEKIIRHRVRQNYSTLIPGSGDGNGAVTITDISHDHDNPIFVVTKIINTEISWMKNVYQLDVQILNEGTESFCIEEAAAVFNLPEGLSLTKTRDGQTCEWYFDKLESGKTASNTWYITGEKRGSYELSLDVEAKLSPFDKLIHEHLVMDNRLEVEAAKGLHLYITPEKTAYIGEKYYVQYKLVNESDKDFYYVKTDFGAFENPSIITDDVKIINEDGNTRVVEDRNSLGMSYYCPDTAIGDARVILQNADTMTVERLKAGDAIYGTYVMQFNAPGDMYEIYYELIKEYAEKTNAGELGMEVSISTIDGHITKTVKEINVPTITTNTPENKDSTQESTDESNQNNPTTEDDNNNVKDPINLMTGAFNITHSPVAVSGGMDFRFNMAYDSRYTDSAGDLGRGWYHNYEMRLEHNGSLIKLYSTPDNVLYFAESDETANIVSGTVDGDRIILAAEDNVDRTYYQTGDSTKKYVIKKVNGQYILTMGAEMYTFDKNGTMTGYMDDEGKKLVISRTDDELIITDPATNKNIIASYNEDGRIVSIKDPAGNETQLEYENDCLTELTSKDGNVLSYSYDDNGKILSGSENGRVYVENTYDDDGRVTSQINNGKKDDKTIFTYETDADGNVTAVMKNADGTTETGKSDKYGQGLYYKNAIGGVRKYLYNEQSDMTEFSDIDGSGKTYSYDERGNITEIKENTGKVLTYTYDDNNHVTSIKGNDGTDITYSYNDKGQRIKVESGNGITADYTYNEYGQVLTEKSALGTIKYEYEDGMLARMTDYNGNVHSFSYDANGNVTSYTDGAGITTDYQVDVRGNVTKETVHLDNDKVAVTSYTYDAYGNMLSKTDAKGNKTEYQYDDDDHLTKEIRPDGTYYEYKYDNNGNIIEIVCPDGETKVSSAYDAAGNALSVTDMLGSIQNAQYSAGSQILSLMQANGGKISYTYYDNGLLKTQTDANGNTSTLTYDEAGRLSTVTDGAGAVTTLSYDADGNLSLVENALGSKTQLKYNEYRKVAEATDNNGNVTWYEYDSSLNCIKVTDAEGGVTEFSYDARNRITSVTKKGSTKAEDITLSMTYDNLDNVTSITDGEGNTHRMKYNELSQLIKVYDAKGVVTGQYDYDSLGNCISATDAFGVVTRRSYDAFGNLIKELNKDTGNASNYAYIGGKYLSASTDALGNSASYTYDSMGNLETVTNPNGGVTTYKYDLNNNVTDEIIGEEYHVKYTYNAQNLAESKTNSRNQKAEYKYDLLGRIIEQKDEAGTISYTYDGNDNVLTVTETVGTAAELAGAKTTTITRTYDKLNRVTSYEDGRGNTIGYEYDILGNLITLTYPNGRDVNYTYDKNGNILTMTDWEGRKTSYSYDENGRLVKTIRPNGTVETKAYDKAGRLIEILDKKDDIEVNHQEYSYDSSGNITEVKQLSEGELNFTGVTSAEMTYDENNRLLTYNGENIKYDKDGNMIYGPLDGKMTDFVYDCRNRLVQAGDTTYTYDAENNRIGVETNEKKIEYTINTQPELSQVLQSTETKFSETNNNETTTYYFYGNGLTSQDDGKDYFAYHFNNVGSTMAVTDIKGNIVETYNYTPYGELIDGEYRQDILFLYNGQYGVTTDSNGLYYMRARYYNVEIKRFINQDVLLGVLERVSSLNRYAYVEGNPISYIDPFGLSKSIYDDAYNKLTKLEDDLLYLCTALDSISLADAFIVKFISEGVYIYLLLAELIPVLILYCAEIGVGIGKAYEGLFEDDYSKIDDGYAMVGEAIQKMSLALSTIALDQLTGTPVYGAMSDVFSWMGKLSNDFNSQ